MRGVPPGPDRQDKLRRGRTGDQTTSGFGVLDEQWGEATATYRVTVLRATVTDAYNEAQRKTGRR
jgi:hypothetical protein